MAGKGFNREFKPSAELAVLVGSKPITRAQVVRTLWKHIKKNNLQNPKNKREILADAKLQPIFGGKKKVTMFEMSKHLGNHLS